MRVPCFSGPRKHHVQHLFQNVRVPFRTRDPLQKPHQGAAVQMFRVRPRFLDKGTIVTELIRAQSHLTGNKIEGSRAIARGGKGY